MRSSVRTSPSSALSVSRLTSPSRSRSSSTRLAGVRSSEGTAVLAIALLLWAHLILSSDAVRRSAALFVTGALAGGAALFRPELAPVAVLSSLSLALALTAPQRLTIIVGFAVALAPLALHVVVAGP